MIIIVSIVVAINIVIYVCVYLYIIRRYHRYLQQRQKIDNTDTIAMF